MKSTQRHVMACIKHFAANSIERSRFKVNVKVEQTDFTRNLFAAF